MTGFCALISAIHGGGMEGYGRWMDDAAEPHYKG